MTWVRFEDRFPWHRKVRGLSDAAFRLHVSAVCWCCEHLTDGVVPTADLPLVSDVKRPEKAVAELVQRGSWDVTSTGWSIHDFLVYNESREVVLARREADAERKRKWRNGGSPGGVRPDGQVDSTLESAHTVPSRPVPSPLPPTEVVAGKPAAAQRGTRIPDAWPAEQDKDALWKWAIETCPAVAIGPETSNWQDWHRAKGDTAKDWNASWRTWMRRAQKDAERRPGGQLALVRPASPRVAEQDATLRRWMDEAKGAGA